MTRKLRLDPKYWPLLITITLFFGLYLYGVIQYRGFSSPQVFFNLWIDNAFLLITSIGMTFVIISGGIDLSVGAVIAFTTVFSAFLLEDLGLSPAIVIPAVLLFGVTMGATMGANVRVGMEDSLWCGPGRLAESNAEQVRKMRQVLEGLSLEVATPADARSMLQLKGGDNVNF